MKYVIQSEPLANNDLFDPAIANGRAKGKQKKKSRNLFQVGRGRARLKAKEARGWKRKRAPSGSL